MGYIIPEGSYNHSTTITLSSEKENKPNHADKRFFQNENIIDDFKELSSISNMQKSRKP